MKTRELLSAGILLAFVAAAGGVYWWTRAPGAGLSPFAQSQRAIGELGPDADSAAENDVKRPAADFTLPDLQGKSLKLSSLRGKTVLLDFWATWCGPCIEDIPSLNALQAKYEGKGFTVVAISIDDANSKEVAAFAREHQIAYPVLLTGGQDKIPDGYAVFGLPTAYLIDPSGVVRRKYFGPKDEDELARDIEDILKHAQS